MLGSAFLRALPAFPPTPSTKRGTFPWVGYRDPVTEEGKNQRAGSQADRRAAATTDPDESPKERVDRELIELFNGLRVILPGVQVLLAFLLTVPFSSGFQDATSTDKIVYFTTVLLTVGATGRSRCPLRTTGSDSGKGTRSRCCVCRTRSRSSASRCSRSR